MTSHATTHQMAHRRRLRGLILALALVLTALPTAPALADEAVAMSDYKLARVDGRDYVFDVPVPQELAAMLTCEALGGVNSSYCEQFTETAVDGTPATVVQTRVTWDPPMFKRRSIASVHKKNHNPFKWKEFSPAAWPEVSRLVQERAVGKGDWKHADMMVLSAPVPTDAPVRVPIPGTVYAQLEMDRLAKQTVLGTYYPNNTKQPQDLAAFQQQMLAYSNTARRDPNFRKDNGATKALDLSRDTVVVEQRAERVHRHNPTPPFFADQQLSPELNKAAQFQAEYNASRALSYRYKNMQAHVGPNSFTFEGKSGSMADLGDRARFFGAPANIVEGAGGGLPGAMPFSWMTGDTHFRPFFNVDADYPYLGYGAAQDKNGDWHYIVKAQYDSEIKPLSEVKLPIEGATGTTTPDGDSAKLQVVVPAPTEDAESNTEPEDKTAEKTDESSQAAVANAACVGFADYLRQEVASKEATLTVAAEGDRTKCQVVTPDLTVSELVIAPLSGQSKDALTTECTHVAEGRTTNADGFDIEQLGATIRATDSSGSSGKSFKFIVGDTPAADGVDQRVQAISCDADHQFRARLDYRPGNLNPLLAVNAAAEAMRRAEAASQPDTEAEAKANAEAEAEAEAAVEAVATAAPAEQGCEGVNEPAPNNADNAARLRCLIEQARADAGLPAYSADSKATYYAAFAAGGGRLNPTDVCPGDAAAAEWKHDYVTRTTAQEAFAAMGGAQNSWVTSSATELGVGFGRPRGESQRFTLFRATCR